MHSSSGAADFESFMDGGPCPASGPPLITTIMIKNVPRRHTPSTLLAEMETFWGKGLANFVYVPWSLSEVGNMGIAFTNFVSPAAAKHALAAVSGQKWPSVRSSRPIKVAAAFVQGLAENISYCARKVPTDVNHEHLPLVWHQGQKVDFQSAVQLYAQPGETVRHRKTAPCAQPQQTAHDVRLSYVQPRAPSWEQAAAERQSFAVLGDGWLQESTLRANGGGDGLALIQEAASPSPWSSAGARLAPSPTNFMASPSASPGGARTEHLRKREKPGQHKFPGSLPRRLPQWYGPPRVEGVTTRMACDEQLARLKQTHSYQKTCRDMAMKLMQLMPLVQDASLSL